MGLARRQRSQWGLPTACMSERELPDCERVLGRRPVRSGYLGQTTAEILHL